MSPGALLTSADPTRAAWLAKARPAAERAVAQLWRTDPRAALLWRTPRKRDRTGRSTDGVERKQSRLQAFDDFRSQLTKCLASAAPDAAKPLVAASEFRDAVRVAFNRTEAVERFAEFLVCGDNAWADCDAGSGVLSICFWRD